MDCYYYASISSDYLELSLNNSFSASDSIRVKFDLLLFGTWDGNATNQTTKSYWKLDKLKNLDWKIINGQSWNDKKDGKRIRNSEFLIFPKIEIKHVDTISCYDTSGLLIISSILKKKNLKINININKNLFF